MTAASLLNANQAECSCHVLRVGLTRCAKVHFSSSAVTDEYAVVMMLFNLYPQQMKIWVPQIVPLMVGTLTLPGNISPHCTSIPSISCTQQLCSISRSGLPASGLLLQKTGNPRLQELHSPSGSIAVNDFLGDTSCPLLPLVHTYSDFASLKKLSVSSTYLLLM